MSNGKERYWILKQANNDDLTVIDRKQATEDDVKCGLVDKTQSYYHHIVSLRSG